jgi:signal-transduction protein with cAMP-binding, CBS, and nucleotidyltransferase domain
MSSIQEAAKKIKENVSLLVVVDGSGKSQGLVIERDLLEMMR